MPLRIDTSLVREYLLGLLPDEAAVDLEQAYFADPVLADEIAAIEHDLVDEYVGHELSPQERGAFERHYLTSAAHQERVSVAAALRAAADRAGAPGLARDSRAVVVPLPLPWGTRFAQLVGALPPAARWSIAAVLILASVGLWMSTRQGDVAREAQLPEPRTNVEVPAPAPMPPDDRPPLTPEIAPPAPRAVTFVLAQVLTRSEGSQPAFVVPAGVEQIELQLSGEPVPGTRLVADIRTPEGRSIWSGAATAPAGSALLDIAASISVPQDRLPAGDYIISLSPIADPDTPVGRYSLRIVRK